MKAFKNLVAVLALLGLFGGLACSEKSDRLTAVPEQKHEKIGEEYDAHLLGAKVDILFVVDNSGSMQVHQRNLASNIDLFISEVTTGNSTMDYRIAVTTTDSNMIGGTFITTPGAGNFVDKNTANGSQVLKKRLVVGTDSSTANEQMFNPVKRAFTKPLLDSTNKGFLRADAHLAVIFITDAEDQSDATAPYETPETLVTFLDGLKGAGRWMSYGAILPLGRVQCERQEDPPYELQRYLTMTNSPYFSLCAPDFGKNLASIGSNLASRVGNTLLLDRLPIVETIKISYGTQVIPQSLNDGWSYKPSDNSIHFGPDLLLTRQPAGTQFKISFVTRK